MKESEPDQPPSEKPADWDGLDVYTGPEEKELNPVLAFLVSAAAPVFLSLLAFAIGGFLLGALPYMYTAGKFRRAVRDPLELAAFEDTFLGGFTVRFILGGVLGILALWLITRKDRPNYLDPELLSDRHNTDRR